MRQKTDENDWHHWQPSQTDVSVRDVTSDDFGHLVDIYRSTREQELNLTNWDENQKSLFIKSQFDAQDFHYKKYYSDARFWMIERKGEIAGRLYLNVSDQMRIIDIALLPSFRNTGLGTSILKDLQMLAKDLGVPVSIHVEQFNPARNLYKRLGFMEKETVNSIYILMQYNHPS